MDQAAGLRIEVLDAAHVGQADLLWRELEQRVAPEGLTSSWAWVSTWLDHFGPEIPSCFAFAFAERQTAPVGAAVLCRSAFKLRPYFPTVPSLYIGPAMLPRPERIFDGYNRLLVGTEHLDAFARALLESVGPRRQSMIVGAGLVPEHAAALMRAADGLGMHFTADERICPTFDFETADATDVISALPNRKVLKRRIRRLDTPPGSLRTEWAETTEQAIDILHDLVALHTRRWEQVGEGGYFKTERVVEYHADLIRALHPKRVIAFRVRQGERTIGCQLSFVEDGRILGCGNGYDLSEDLRGLGPGIATQALFMEKCRRRGYREYDMLDGGLSYKQQLANKENRLVWLTLPGDLRGHLLQIAMSISYNPTVGDLRKRLRKLRGRLGSAA